MRLFLLGYTAVRLTQGSNGAAAVWCIYYTATLSRHRHKKSDYGQARQIMVDCNRDAEERGGEEEDKKMQAASVYYGIPVNKR